MTAAVFVLVGPGDLEVARTRDLVTALRRHEPGIAMVLLVDDVPGRLRHCRFDAPFDVRVVDNPRRGRGTPRMGGLCVGAIAAVKLLQADTDADFVLKVDPDALVIAPFVDAIGDEFRSHSGVGALGTLVVWEHARRHMPLVTPRRAADVLRASRRRPDRVRRLATGLYRKIAAETGPRRRIRRTIRRARSAGYVMGEHCQGGAYALRRSLIDRLAELGHLDDPMDWIGSWFAEDVLFGLLASAAGLPHADFSAPGQPFASSHRGLPAPLEELVARGHSLIHSVKDDSLLSEADIRHRFDLHATDGLL